MNVAERASDIAEKVLDVVRARADAAEVVYEESEERSVNFQDNRLKSVNTKSLRGVGLRVIQDGRLGFSCTNDLDRVDELVAHSLDSAGFGQEAKFQFPAEASGGREVKLYDPAVVGLPAERAAAIVRGGIDFILGAFPAAHCGGGVSWSRGRSVLLNSRGLHDEELTSGYHMGIDAFLVRDESFLSVDDGELSCRFSGDILCHAREVVKWIELCEREVRLDGAERMPVLFTPHAVSLLLATFESNTNGKTVQKGASVLTGRIGERVLDSCITMWDDPLVDYASGSMSVDAEGVPAHRKALFENGVLRTFIYDLQTAGMVGAHSTGNGVRGYSEAPRPGNSNIRIAPGPTPHEEILAGMKRGLLIESALGAGMSNTLAGEYSVNVELGFLVENGEVIGRVKDCMLALNAFDAFNHIRDISAEAEWHGSVELPWICFESLSVAGRRQ